MNQNASIGPPGAGTPPRKRLLKLKAAAEYLSLSPWKIRNLVHKGLLPVVQDTEGAPFLLDVRDLDGYIERNKRTEVM